MIAVAVAGMALGDEAATGGIQAEMRGLLGDAAAGAVETMMEKASLEGGAGPAGAISFLMLLLAASGTFGALQSALNAVWKAETPDARISGLVRAKLAALGLVAATAFLALVSLMASAAISSFGGWLAQMLPGGAVLARLVELAVSSILLGVLFAVIYKVLPDRSLAWRDVMVGAAATSAMRRWARPMARRGRSWSYWSGSTARR